MLVLQSSLRIVARMLVKKTENKDYFIEKNQLLTTAEI